MKASKSYFTIKRLLDIFVSLLAGIVLLPVAGVVAIVVKFNSIGPILFWSDRIGKDNVVFKMPKFRTMKVDTPAVATHLLQDAESHLTSIGGFLRKTSLDELPQLWSVFFGHMSLIGPRPALHNQDDLIKLRTENGIHSLRPGITGWAQINGRDEISINEKVTFDSEYLNQLGHLFDLKILLITIMHVLKRKSV